MTVFRHYTCSRFRLSCNPVKTRQLTQTAYTYLQLRSRVLTRNDDATTAPPSIAANPVSLEKYKALAIKLGVGEFDKTMDRFDVRIAVMAKLINSIVGNDSMEAVVHLFEDRELRKFPRKSLPSNTERRWRFLGNNKSMQTVLCKLWAQDNFHAEHRGGKIASPEETLEFFVCPDTSSAFALTKEMAKVLEATLGNDHATVKAFANKIQSVRRTAYDLQPQQLTKADLAEFVWHYMCVVDDFAGKDSGRAVKLRNQIESHPEFTSHKCHKDNVPLVNAEWKLRTGTMFRASNFEIVAGLGGGNFGRVFLVRFFTNGVEYRVVMKVERFTVDDFMTYLRREVIGNTMFSHPNIARTFTLIAIPEIYDQKHPITVGIVMEQCGPDLYGISKEVYANPSYSKPQKLYELHKIFLQVLDAVNTMNSEGFRHRDVKPENIVRDTSALSELRVKLIDFGLSRTINEDEGSVTHQAGTKGFVPPEGHGPTHDSFSTGVSYYVVLSGNKPDVQGLTAEDIRHDLGDKYDGLSESLATQTVEFVRKWIHADLNERLTGLQAYDTLKGLMDQMNQEYMFDD